MPVKFAIHVPASGRLPTSVVDPNTTNLDPNPGFWTNRGPEGFAIAINFERQNLK